MDAFGHQFSTLFAQLGLPDEVEAIQRFIETHAPLDEHVRLEDASCWSEGQAQMLREELANDADWSGVIDQLNLALRRSRSMPSGR